MQLVYFHQKIKMTSHKTSVILFYFFLYRYSHMRIYVYTTAAEQVHDFVQALVGGKVSLIWSFRMTTTPS